MATKRSLILFLFSSFYILSVFSQGEIDEEQKIFYRNERSWALLINTNGFGGGYRHANRINAFRKFIWDIDMNYVKHPKETKITNTYSQVNQFVFGKVNFAWEIRGGAGFQREIFRKADKSGISIRYFYDAGPTLIFLKPIYYRVELGGYEVDQKFDLYASQFIIGKSSFFKGINEIKIDPGVFVKAGLCFEYSKQDIKFQALEIGGVASGFLNEVEMMASNNTRFLFSLFISFRWGRVVSGSRMEGVDLELEDDIY